LKKRLGIFETHDSDGVADEYIFYLLDDLVKNLSHLVIVCNGEYNEESIIKFKNYTPDIYIRDNYGFDFGAYKDTLIDFMGWDKIHEYDELVLLNDTCYGPLFPFEVMFSEMDNRNVDFWGITEVEQIKSEEYFIPYHISSYFFVFRKSLLLSKEFMSYWTNLEYPTTLDLLVNACELGLTKYFTDYGYKCGSYVDCSPFSGNMPLACCFIYFDVYRLTAIQGCPLVKRKAFTWNFLSMIDYNSCDAARRTLDYIDSKTNYDIRLIWENLIRFADPVVLYNMLHLHYVVPHDFCYNADILNTRRIDFISSDISSLLTGSKNQLGEFDYVCIIPDDTVDTSVHPSVNRSYNSLLRENISKNDNYIKNIISCFDKNPLLGVLFAPGLREVHCPTDYNKEYCVDIIKKLKLRCKLSDDSFSIPIGKAFWFRPSALKTLLAYSFELSDFSARSSLNPTIERVIPYAAQHEGFFCGTVSTSESASLYSVLHQSLAHVRLTQSFEYADYITVSNESMERFDQLSGFFSKCSRFYIFGARRFGSQCMEKLSKDINIDGFVVSDGHKVANSTIHGISVFELSELSPDENMGVIVAVGPKKIDEVLRLLDDRGFKNVIKYIPKTI